MHRLGFIRDMMDVKVLLLFVMARVSEPVTAQEVYELSYHDECLSYFDVCTALPEMVESGHLIQEDEKYTITEKGRQTVALTEDSIAYTVKQRAENAVDRFNRQLRRKSQVRTQVVTQENGELAVVMALDDEAGNLMTLQLSAPDRRQAVRLGKLFEDKAENVYSLVMLELLEDEENLED